MKETVRGVLEERLRAVLEKFDVLKNLSEEGTHYLILELADEACSALGIDDEEQEEERWPEEDVCEQCGAIDQFYGTVKDGKQVVVCRNCGLEAEDEEGAPDNE